MSNWTAPLWTLLGVVVGTVLQHIFWKLQYSEISHSMERRERRREQTIAAERIQSVSNQAIDLASSPFSGPQINQTEVTTQTLVELLRLQRELRAITASSGELFSDQRHQQLETFRSKLAQIVLRNPQEQVLDSLRTELTNLCGDLRKDIPRSP